MKVSRSRPPAFPRQCGAFPTGRGHAGAASAGCRVDYAITNSWQGGFGANVQITNLGDAVTSWTLQWSFTNGETVTQAWNADVTPGSAQVTAKSLSYNGSVPSGGSVGFGFNGSVPGSAQPAVPSSFTLNGTTCTGSSATSGGTSSGSSSGTTSGSSSGTTSGSTGTPPAGHGWQVEKLDRGVIAVRSGSGNLVSWRWLATDPDDVAFNVYRGGTRLTSSPLTGATDYLDAGGAAGASYTVRAVVNGAEQAAAHRRAAGSPPRPVQRRQAPQ